MKLIAPIVWIAPPQPSSFPARGRNENTKNSAITDAA